MQRSVPNQISELGAKLIDAMNGGSSESFVLSLCSKEAIELSYHSAVVCNAAEKLVALLIYIAELFGDKQPAILRHVHIPLSSDKAPIKSQ